MSSARFVVLAGLAILLITPAPAWAQNAEGFAVNRFHPSERGSDWFASESLDFRGHRRLVAGVVLDYANSPLVAYGPNGSVAAYLLKHQLYAHLGASFLLYDRIRVATSLPALLLNRGESIAIPAGNFSAAQGVALGDARLSADARLLGEYREGFSLALGAQAHLPTGSQQSFASDGSLRVQPRVMTAGEVGWLSYATTIGFQFRPSDAQFASSELGSEIVMTAAAGTRLLDGRLLVGPEVTASTTATEPLDELGTPLEALLGAHYNIAKDWRVGVGAGLGLTQGLGSPRFRALSSLQWVPSADASFGREVDSDSDGVLDSSDLCPTIGAGKEPDPARSGCPLLDRDGDGIADSKDACPGEAGLASPKPAEHGCPPAPTPVSDRDGDGIPDSVDACPDEKGIPSAHSNTHGCRAARLERALRQIRILQRIEFKYDSDNLAGRSEDVLQGVHDILMEHPEITLVEIQGHTDNIGTPGYNKELSERRAETVRRWLVGHGIDSSHLTAVGYGQDKPLAANDTPEGRQANRRVEFHILADSEDDEARGAEPSPVEAERTKTGQPSKGDKSAPRGASGAASSPPKGTDTPRPD